MKWSEIVFLTAQWFLLVFDLEACVSHGINCDRFYISQVWEVSQLVILREKNLIVRYKLIILFFSFQFWVYLTISGFFSIVRYTLVIARKKVAITIFIFYSGIYGRNKKQFCEKKKANIVSYKLRNAKFNSKISEISVYIKSDFFLRIAK